MTTPAEPRMLKTEGYLILEPARHGYSGQIAGIKVDRWLTNKPRLGVREVAVWIKVEVDAALFLQPEPEVTLRLTDGRALVIPEIEPIVEPVVEVDSNETEEESNG